jgi:peptide/nickel transport system substrate-binding protein
MGFLAAACGDDDDVGPTSAPTAAPTAAPATDAPMEPVTVRVGLAPPPSQGIDPVLINDEAGLSVLGQTGQYLAFSDSELNLRPVLAQSWEPNDTFDAWTFHLDPAATFNDGTPVTAADVVATFNGPIGEGNAGSAYETFGVTPFEAAEVVDPQTVRFNLARPNGAFPFFVSSDNYNATILPASFWNSYEAGAYEQSFIGSGEWVNESYDVGVGATYVKNPNYWGDSSGQPDRMEVSFFADDAAMVTAFQDGRLDVLYRVAFSQAETLEAAGAKLQTVSTAGHRQIYMDASQTEGNPFADKRVRQAAALALNRPVLLEGALGGFGVLGNDHPIWQFFPMFNDTAVPQRAEDLDEARTLLTAAGLGDGFSANLDTLQFSEIEDLAQLIKSSLAQINIDLTLRVTDSSTYYQDFWCSWPYEGPCQPGAQGSMGIVNYGHRGVPNVYLGAPLLSDGQWNSSHWVGEGYDDKFNDFAAAPDPDVQKRLAGEIQSQLWDEVPFIVPYFVDFISVVAPNFEGLEVTGMGHFDISKGRFTG